MKCPKCEGVAEVTHSDAKDKEYETVRYHKCKECDHNFTTIERLKSGWIYEERIKKLIKSIKKVVKEYED